MNIGVIGGTGPAGRGLVARLASVGHEVVLGSRSEERAAEMRARIIDSWPGRSLNIVAGHNSTAADAELVIMGMLWDGAATTAASLEPKLRGKVVISMCNALTRLGGEFQPLVPPRGSVAASVQAAAPGAMVAAALHHIPARELGRIDEPLPCDVLVCSDYAEATKAASELIAEIPGVRSLDAGSLSAAAPIEAFTAVLLQLNARYSTRVSLSFTGIEGLEAPGADA